MREQGIFRVDHKRLLAILESLDPGFGRFVESKLAPTDWPMIKILKDMLLKPVEHGEEIKGSILISKINKEKFRTSINKIQAHPQAEALYDKTRKKLAEVEADQKIPVVVVVYRDDGTPFSFFIVPMEMLYINTNQRAQA